jgi:shikimate kinase
MGAGKSSLGRRLAAKLEVLFRDADAEIEVASGCSIPEIFARYGEGAFRDCERRVIDRLLGEAPHVLATGGGAFVDTETRARLKQAAVTVWLNVPLDVLVARVKRKDNRPLLKDGDPREILERLLRERGPFYAEADLTITGDNGPHADAVERIVSLLAERGDWESI